ncbi:hypothetical protein JCM11641_004351 [Rhodosporidiobolus odoratus]
MAAVPGRAVLLLLGGRSTRMGEPKHLLPHPLSSQPLYLHHLDMLTQLERDEYFPSGVFVSAREDQRNGLKLPETVQVILDDPSLDIGPAGGIIQAFSSRPNATWLLLAVDLPFVTRYSILHLLSSHSPVSPVSLYLHPEDGNPEPLFSIWTPPALKQLEENCKKGKSGPCRAAKDIWGGKIIEGKGGVKVLEENWVRDADTKEEWGAAIEALSGGIKTAKSLPPTPPLSPDVSVSLPTAQPTFAPKRRLHIPFASAIGRIYKLSLSRPASSAPRPSPCPPSTFSATTTSASSSPLPTLPLLHAVGHTSASDILAVFPHPLQDNSAMDGYALPSSLLASASPSSPTSLPILGRIIAGDPPPPSSYVSALGTQGCWEVMTGAVFPSEAFDAVVKVEDAELTQERDSEGRAFVRFSGSVRERQNRRKRGEQVQRGDVVLRRGQRITPEKVMLLAAVGVAELAVQPDSNASQPRPAHKGKVGILSTGKEIICLASLSPGVEPSPGQVIDCVTPYLSALLSSLGYDPILLPTSGDSSSSFASSVSAALSPSSSSPVPLDMLITTAGVSLGVTDHLPSTLSSLGLTQIFHGVSIRPGAPVMLSLHTNPDTGRKTPVLSLPGNPMASAVGMRSFGREVLNCLGGIEERETGWEEFDVPTSEGGVDEEEARAWVELVEKVKEGSTSFFALPLDQEGKKPMLMVPGRHSNGIRVGPCALGSLVHGQAWVRIEGVEGGGKRAMWCRF